MVHVYETNYVYEVLICKLLTTRKTLASIRSKSKNGTRTDLGISTNIYVCTNNNINVDITSCGNGLAVRLGMGLHDKPSEQASERTSRATSAG